MPGELKSSRPQASVELTSFSSPGVLGLHPMSYKKGVYKWRLTSVLWLPAHPTWPRSYHGGEHRHPASLLLRLSSVRQRTPGEWSVWDSEHELTRLHKSGITCHLLGSSIYRPREGLKQCPGVPSLYLAPLPHCPEPLSSPTTSTVTFYHLLLL